MPIADYWQLTLGQFKRALEGYRRRTQDEARNADALNHILGSYIAKAFHQPNKYPKQPLLAEKDATQQSNNRVMSDDEMNLIGRLIARRN